MHVPRIVSVAFHLHRTDTDVMRLCCSEYEEWVPPKQRMKRHHATSKGAMTEATGQTNGTKKSNTFGSGGSAFQVRLCHPYVFVIPISHALTAC